MKKLKGTSIMNLLWGFGLFLVIGFSFSPTSWNTAPGQVSNAVTVKAGTTKNDTMTLAALSAGQNVIALQRNGAAGDTVKAIEGTTNLLNGFYLFKILVDDSSVTFIDGGNLKLNGNFTLDKTDDRLLLEWDGTNFYTMGTPASNE